MKQKPETKTGIKDSMFFLITRATKSMRWLRIKQDGYLSAEPSHAWAVNSESPPTMSQNGTDRIGSIWVLGWRGLSMPSHALEEIPTQAAPLRTQAELPRPIWPGGMARIGGRLEAGF